MLYRYTRTPLIAVFMTVAAVFLTSQTVMAQPGNPETPAPQHTPLQSFIPEPGIKPHPDLPVRTMQRTGTAITGARNSVSIKSTDAGIIHYPPAVPAIPYPAYPGYAPSASSCVNCGIIDSISLIGRNNALNAIASGIVAGTIARRIGEHGAYPHAQNELGRHPDHKGNHPHYQVGITLQDGSRQVLTVPDVTHLHRGDRIQLIDGMIVPEHTGQ